MSNGMHTCTVPTSKHRFLFFKKNDLLKWHRLWRWRTNGHRTRQRKKLCKKAQKEPHKNVTGHSQNGDARGYIRWHLSETCISATVRCPWKSALRHCKRKKVCGQDHAQQQNRKDHTHKGSHGCHCFTVSCVPVLTLFLVCVCVESIEENRNWRV